MTGSDIFHITEMISRNVTLEMNEDTYDCILESIFGLKPLPASRIPILNNLSITFVVFTNPLTKFSFFIFRYSKKNHPDFTDAFKSCLSTEMKSVNIDSTTYLQPFYVLVPYEKSDQSASAHLS